MPALLNCDYVYTFKSRLKIHLFSTAFSAFLLNHLLHRQRQRLCSRLTALRRYINFVLLFFFQILLLLLLLLLYNAGFITAQIAEELLDRSVFEMILY